jgi:hypothetical protein
MLWFRFVFNTVYKRISPMHAPGPAKRKWDVVLATYVSEVPRPPHIERTAVGTVFPSGPYIVETL